MLLEICGSRCVYTLTDIRHGSVTDLRNQSKKSRLTIGHWVMNFISTPSASSCAQLTLTCAAVSASVCVFTVIFSVDLRQMDDMALKWCEKPLWVTLSMTPYDFMARDIGYLAGITYALHCLELIKINIIQTLKNNVTGF
uniref:Uncharacterized protein n=1 Tax=Romanomermis culicivorax TaxID=13658 RepID=A0A915HIF0_ROMCU